MRKIGVDHDIVINFFGLLSGRTVWDVEGVFFSETKRSRSKSATM